MEIKHYKRLSSLIGFLLGILIFGDILDYIFFAKKILGNSTSLIIAHGFYIAGLISVFVFFLIILENIKKYQKKRCFYSSERKSVSLFWISNSCFGFNFRHSTQKYNRHRNFGTTCSCSFRRHVYIYLFYFQNRH